MKYDCFTFLNEIDLLELRLEYLSSCIDYFVIVESNLTFSGNQKPYFFDESKDRFAKWSDKIIYLALEQSLDGLPNGIQNNLGSYAWLLEFQQRNAIKEAITVNPEDLIFIGDIDEVPDSEVINRIKSLEEPMTFSMSFHYYFMNCKSIGDDRFWNGTICVPGEYFNKYTPQEIRNNRNHYSKMVKSGWHFSYLGGIETIKYKIQSFAHTEYNNTEYLADDNLQNALLTGSDIFKRRGFKFKVVPLFLYPSHIRRCMKNKPDFIREVSILKWIIQSAYEYFGNLFASLSIK